MEKKIKIVQNYFPFLLLTTFIILSINGLIGASQDKVYLQDSIKLKQVEMYIEENKYQEAEPLVAELSAKHPESYQLQWYYGRCLAAKEDYAKAKNCYDTARTIAPLVVKDKFFLLELAEIEYKLMNYETASKYLQVAELTITDSSEKQKIEAMLNDISKS